MRRVVLDTTVVVSALRSRHGASNAVLRLVGQGRLVPLVSTALFLEYEDVLKRPEHVSVHGLGPAALERFLAAFAAAAEGVEIDFRWRPQLRDEKDELVLEAAVNGRAEGLVTFNGRDFEPAATRFGVSILTPAVLLEKVRP